MQREDTERGIFGRKYCDAHKKLLLCWSIQNLVNYRAIKEMKIWVPQRRGNSPVIWQIVCENLSRSVTRQVRIFWIHTDVVQKDKFPSITSAEGQLRVVLSCRTVLPYQQRSGDRLLFQRYFFLFCYSKLETIQRPHNKLPLYLQAKAPILFNADCFGWAKVDRNGSYRTFDFSVLVHWVLSNALLFLMHL